MNESKQHPETSINYIKKHLKTIENFVNNKDSSITFKDAEEAMFTLKDFFKKNSAHDFPIEIILEGEKVVRRFMSDPRSGMPDGVVKIIEENDRFKRNLDTNHSDMSEEFKEFCTDFYTILGEMQLGYKVSQKKIDKILGHLNEQ